MCFFKDHRPEILAAFPWLKMAISGGEDDESDDKEEDDKGSSKQSTPSRPPLRAVPVIIPILKRNMSMVSKDKQKTTCVTMGYIACNILGLKSG